MSIPDYSQLLELMRRRRSIRRFAPRPVSREDLDRVLEAARWAPSNHNRQPWRFVVLQEPQAIAGLAERVRQRLSIKLSALPDSAGAYASEFTHYATFFAAAPVLLAVLHKRPIQISSLLLGTGPNAALISGEPLSAAMAVQNVLLASEALGLGACVLTAPLVVHEALADLLAPPAGHEFTCLVALGHPDESPPAPRRKSLDQIAEFRQNPADVSGAQGRL